MDNKFKDYCKTASDVINAVSRFLIIFIILILILCAIDYIVGDTKNNINNDVNKIEHHNDSIKDKIKNLDSIKNAKANEVQYLNNDSTIELFYKIIKSK